MNTNLVMDTAVEAGVNFLEVDAHAGLKHPENRKCRVLCFSWTKIVVSFLFSI